MKFSFLLPTRGNPDGLRQSISSIIDKKTGNNEISVYVGADEDDNPTKIFKAIGHYSSVVAVPLKRKATKGQYDNELARIALNSDAFIPFTDRNIVMTNGWDEIIANYLKNNKHSLLWWNMPEGYIMPIIPAKWYEASGAIYTEYFPFWFDDTWLQEVNIFVHGIPGIKIPAKLWRNSVGKTKRCRDLNFWFDFFIRSRLERSITGCKLNKHFGLSLPSYKQIKHNFLVRDEYWRKNWRIIQKQYGDTSPPDEMYIKAKARASEMMS